MFTISNNMAVLSISRHKHLHVFAHVYTHTLQQFYKLFFSSWGCLFLLFGLKYLHQSSFCFTNLTLGTPWWSFLELTSDHLQKELLVIIHLSRHFSHPPFFSLLKVTKIDSGQVYINSNAKRWFKPRKYIMLCYKILIKKNMAIYTSSTLFYQKLPTRYHFSPFNIQRAL